MSQHRAPSVLGLAPSFGFGDRIGLATPGHAEAVRRDGGGIAPIFAQQSIREMARTGRDPEQVMADALRGLEEAGWSGEHGADADHLKTRADADRTLAAGFTFFTLDPSEHVDGRAGTYDAGALRERYEAVRAEVDWADRYRGQEVRLATGTVVALDEEAVLRAAVKYGRALNHVADLAAHIAAGARAAGRDHEIEVSVDETPEPTTLAEHYIIADQCRRRGVNLVSLAPRFIGDMEKGIDYIGDLAALERSLRDHAAVAERAGPYKLSLHSGSDKLSMYTPFARATRGRFHVKTAGTSYLEALRVAARRVPDLFRGLCAFARERYEEDKASYHVRGTLDDVPPPEEVADDRELQRLYLECWEDVPPGRGFTRPGRQILHCTFGSVLTHPDLGTALRDCLLRFPETYREVLAAHFGRHLEALRAGL